MKPRCEMAGAHEMTFLPLLVVVAVAFLVPLLLARLRPLGIPIVVGEMVAGIAIGKSGLGIVEEDVLLRVLSNLGFAYLMFLSGLEFDLSAIWDTRSTTEGSRLTRLLRNPMVAGVVSFAMTLAMSVLAAHLLAWLGLARTPWIVALILATTSLGVVVPVLKERGLIHQPFGQGLLVAALVADFAGILLISLYVVLHSQGLTVELLMVLVLLAAFLLTYRLMALFRERLPLERFITRISTATSQIRTRGAFALALIFIGLAEGLGMESILGAFLAGIIVSLLSGKEGSLLREKLDAIGYGFFIPIFFIMVGVGFDLPALLESNAALALVPLLIGIAYLVKLLPALVLRLRFSWRETLTGGLLLSARLSLIIAAAAVGVKMGVISEAINAAVILVAITTCTISPVVFNVLSAPPASREMVIVIGARTAAGLLARSLGNHDLLVTLVSDVPGAANVNGTGRVRTVRPGATFLDSLREADADQAAALVAMSPDPDENLRICRAARHRFGVPNVVAWVDDLRRNPQFRSVDARVVNPDSSTLLVIERMVLSPGAFSTNGDLEETQEVQEVKLRNPRMTGKRLCDVPMVGEVMVLSIARNGHRFAPHRDTVLETNDTVVLVGAETAVRENVLLFARAG